MNKTGKFSKKSLKIAAATSGTVFSLVAVFVATFAWFVARRDNSATGMRIKASEETGRLNKIELFEVISVAPKDGHPNYSFNRTPSATMDYSWDEDEDNSFSNFELGDYNPLSTEHPLLLVFSFNMEYISKTAGDVYIKGLSKVDDFLGETENGTPKYNLGTTSPTLRQGSKTITLEDETTKVVDTYPLSSAVNFKCAHYSFDGYDALLENSADERIDINPNDLTLKECFVNFVPASSTITFKKKPTIYSSPGGDTPIYCIAMVVNYDSDAVSAIYSTYLGDSTLEGDYGGELYFTCDWSLEVF